LNLAGRLPHRPKVELVQPEQTLLHNGDWVQAYNGLIYHHGIVRLDPCEGLQVIHRSGLAHKDVKSAEVRITDWAGFAGGTRFVERLDPENPLPRGQVVGNALSQVGNRGYDLLFHNCEHFACWCKTGKYVSAQVQGGMILTGTLGTLALMAIGIAATPEP